MVLTSYSLKRIIPLSDMQSSEEFGLGLECYYDLSGNTEVSAN